MQLKAPKVRWEYLYAFSLASLVVAIVFLQFGESPAIQQAPGSISASLASSTSDTLLISGTAHIAAAACPGMTLLVTPIVQSTGNPEVATVPENKVPLSSTGTFSVAVSKGQVSEISLVSTASSSDQQTTALPLCAEALYTPSLGTTVSLTLESTAIAALYTSGAISLSVTSLQSLTDTTSFKNVEQFLAPAFLNGSINAAMASPQFHMLATEVASQYDQSAIPIH